GLHPLIYRKFKREHHQCIGYSWKKDKNDLEFPISFRSHNESKDTAKYQSSRPAGVKHIQPFGLFFWKHGCYRWVCNRFHCSVAECHYECSDVQHGVSVGKESKHSG